MTKKHRNIKIIVEKQRKLSHKIELEFEVTRMEPLFASEKEYEDLTEDEKRFYQRNLTKKGNYSLNIIARNAGVKNFDKFHNSGYKGLYNGETADDIAKRKNVKIIN